MPLRDKKDMDAFVQRMAAGRKSTDPRAQTVNHLNAKPVKTPRAKSQPTKGVSSNAPPNPVNTEKGFKPTDVQQAKTKVPVVSKGKKGPTQATGSNAGNITHNHFYGREK